MERELGWNGEARQRWTRRELHGHPLDQHEGRGGVEFHLSLSWSWPGSDGVSVFPTCAFSLGLGDGDSSPARKCELPAVDHRVICPLPPSPALPSCPLLSLSICHLCLLALGSCQPLPISGAGHLPRHLPRALDSAMSVRLSPSRFCIALKGSFHQPCSTRPPLPYCAPPYCLIFSIALSPEMTVFI